MARTHLHNPSQAEDTERMLLGSKSGLVTYLKNENKKIKSWLNSQLIVIVTERLAVKRNTRMKISNRDLVVLK